jgi:hypothetical protein
MHSLYTQPGSRFNSRFRFRVLIKLFGSNFFKKNQNDIVLVNKQKSTECNQIFDWINLLGQRG